MPGPSTSKAGHMGADAGYRTRVFSLGSRFQGLSAVAEPAGRAVVGQVYGVTWTLMPNCSPHMNVPVAVLMSLNVSPADRP